LKKFSSAIKYEIIEGPEEQKKPQLKFWIDNENEKKCEKAFGKNILFTDKQKWHTKKIVKTYNSKNFVEDNFKLLNDHLLVPVGPVYHHKDEKLEFTCF
jgi:transposase